MNKKNLTTLALSAVFGISGCLTTKESALVVGIVKDGFCDSEEDVYYLRLSGASIYTKESDEFKAGKTISAYHAVCNLFQPVPEGTLVKVIGDLEHSSDVGKEMLLDLGPNTDADTELGIWSEKTYRFDTENQKYVLIYGTNEIKIDYRMSK